MCNHIYTQRAMSQERRHPWQLWQSSLAAGVRSFLSFGLLDNLESVVDLFAEMTLSRT